MNITELQLYKELRSIDYSEDLAHILRNHGWQKLGSGFEGIVAKHPNKPYALKIYNTNSKYSTFVNLVQHNQSNPHFPKFSRYVKPIKGTEWSYVRMEILQKIKEEDLKTKFLPEICFMYECNKKYPRLSISRTVEDILHYKNSSEIKELAEKTNESWKQAIDLVFNTAKQNNLNHIDLHDENFMQRAGTLIISDPYYS